MAKYTMTLAEYMARGGTLPSSLDLIEGFREHFIGRYFDKEIGFETDALFSLKLEALANLVIPSYKERIDARATYWTKLPNPTKVHYEKATTNYDMGKQTNKTTELPFDSATAEPNLVNVNDAYHNEDTREMRNEENGETLDEVLRAIDYLNKDVSTLVEKCLDEFSNLFMKVY